VTLQTLKLNRAFSEAQLSFAWTLGDQFSWVAISMMQSLKIANLRGQFSARATSREQSGRAATLKRLPLKIALGKAGLNDKQFNNFS